MEEPPPPPPGQPGYGTPPGTPTSKGSGLSPLPSAQPAVEVLIAVTVIGFVAAGADTHPRRLRRVAAASFSPEPSASSQLSRRTNVAGPFPRGSPRSRGTNQERLEWLEWNPTSRRSSSWCRR
jgi:hypothetical protein